MSVKQTVCGIKLFSYLRPKGDLWTKTYLLMQVFMPL